MIRKVRIALLIFFLVVTGIFAYVKVNAAMDADTASPVITADTDQIEVSVEAGTEELLAGMTATDDRDGDVSDSLVVVSKTKFIKTGEVNVNYAAFDSHNNVGTYVRRVVYTDYRSPEFTLKAPLVYRMTENYPDYLTNIAVSDVLDGDLSSMIRMATSMSVGQEDGTMTMPLQLQVTNSAGDTASLDLEVQFLDDKMYSMDAPALTDYLIYTDAGTALEPFDYLNGVRNGLNERAFEDSLYESGDVTVDDSAVDYNTPGVYQIRYTLYEPPTPEALMEQENQDSENPDRENDEDVRYVDEDNDGIDDVLNIVIPEGALEAQEEADRAAAEATETGAPNSRVTADSEALGTTILFVVVR